MCILFMARFDVAFTTVHAGSVWCWRLAVAAGGPWAAFFTTFAVLNGLHCQIRHIAAFIYSAACPALCLPAWGAGDGQGQSADAHRVLHAARGSAGENYGLGMPVQKAALKWWPAQSCSVLISWGNGLQWW